jgi:hypothetical protein
MIYLCVVLLWIIYSSLFGYCDAWYWYSANVAKYSVRDFKFKDLHPQYFWMRSIVGSVFAYSICDVDLLKWFLIMVCFGMVFPFFHNGFFYKTRHEIDNTKYPLGFRDMSTTSIAKVNFTFGLRSLMLAIGLIGLSLIYLL